MEILSLGEKIKRRRKELGMTLKDLAGDRITPGQISLVESGKSNPSMDLLEYISSVLNTSIEYLMESEESQAEKICLYYENLSESYILNDELITGSEYIEKALYYAEKYDLEYRKARNLYLRATIHMKKKEYALAQQIFLSANVIFIKNNDYEEIINTFLNLGKITYELKAYHSCNSYLKQAEKTFLDKRMDNDNLLGEIYYFMASVYFKLENIDKSMKYSYLAKEKFEQLQDKRKYAKSLLLLTEQYHKKGDIDNAINCCEKTLDIFRKLDDASELSKIENNLGKLFYEFDNIEESFKHLNKAKEMRIVNKDKNLIQTLINICDNYIKMKDPENCDRVLGEIYDYIEDGNEGAIIDYYLLRHRVELLKNNVLAAENSLIMALNFANNMEQFKRAGEISITLGKFYIEINKEIEAAKYLNEGVIIFKKLGILS